MGAIQETAQKGRGEGITLFSAFVGLLAVAAMSLVAVSSVYATDVSAGQDLTVAVTFAPTSAGAKSATLAVAYNAAGSPSSVILSGTEPVIGLSPSSMGFGDVQVGQSEQMALTVTNTGNASLSVTGITVTGTDASQFTVSPTRLTVAGGQSGTVTVTFNPASQGAKTASLSITHNAAGSPSTISLSGNGIFEEDGIRVEGSFSPPSMGFEDVRVGQSKQMTLTVTNTGNTRLSVTEITVTGTDASQFTVSPTRLTVAGGQSGTVTVTFNPSARGAKVASLFITHNAANSPSLISLSGNGIFAEGSFSPSSMGFGDVQVGQSKQMTLTVTNTGNASLSVTGITVTGTDASQFTVSPTRLTVAGGQSGTVTVTFNPSAPGLKSASLSVAHNAAGSPSTVALSGTGVGISNKKPSPDFNGDGFVDFEDFFLFAAAFGTEDSEFDLTDDGFVNFDDFFSFAAAFGKKAPKQAAKPVLDNQRSR